MKTKIFLQRTAVGMDLTEGNVFLTVFVFAIPLMLANLVQQMYSTVDLVIVGQCVGKVGLSAVGNGAELLEIYTAFAVGFSSAGQTVVAQLTGAKNYKKMADTIGTQLTLMISIAIVFSAISIIFASQFLRLINTPGEAFAMAQDYLRITALGVPFVFGYNALSGVLRGIGESKRTLQFILIAAVLNVILDYILVFHAGMMAAGSAIATVIAQFFSFAVAVVFFYTKRKALHFELHRSSFRIHKQEFAALVSFGLPMAAHTTLIHISQLFCNAFVNEYGLVASSVNSTGNKIIRFCTIYTHSINAGTSAIVGQNIGARRYDRVHKIVSSGLIIAGGLSIACSALLLLTPHQIFSLFADDPEVIECGVIFLRIAVIGFLLAAFHSPFGAVVTGSGNARLSFIAGVLDGVVLRIGISFMFAYGFGMGVFGFFYGNVLARLAPCVICFGYYLSGNWKRKKLLIDDAPQTAGEAE